MHQKTGVLSLDLPKGRGKVAFREGCIINASYGETVNQEAIFSILGEKKGLYRFTSGLSPSEMRAAEIEGRQETVVGGRWSDIKDSFEF